MRATPGYTLVELMVVMTISTIILLVSVVIILTARKQLQAGMASVDLQQSLGVITEVLQNELRQASADNTYLYADYTTLGSGPVTNTGTCLKIVRPDSSDLVVYQSAKDFILQRGGFAHALVRNCLDSLFFMRSGGADSPRVIQARLRLANDNDNLSTTQSFWLRN